MSGYIVLFAGGAIAWSTKKQSTIALSMAKAEYIVATHIAKQVLWHRTFCEELSFPQPTTSTIFCDNQAGIMIAHHCYGTASCLLSYLINHASPILSNELSNTSVWML